MITKKKAVKILIIFILFGFLVITGLSAIVPYIGGNGTISDGTGEVDTGIIADSGVIVADDIDSGNSELPTMTKEEASEKLQQSLSGLIAPAVTK